ncbi:hypothetical protein CBF34_08040 [Vagococcus penaei]|uniref:DUF3324 domain-containing protein n=1 Tax=Vagococcus penaei TaxID=633807 RepID=UPI000F88A535|nr:DUF3324 domain-containing protein [Vagococcus penaei]RSU00831.1 hypothetical protein CBF34_08040 [Vagococcus penaei]
MTIKNKVAYTIGLSLTESDEPVKVALDLIDVKPVIGQGIQATIQNSQPLVIDGITYHAKVTKKGQQRIIYQTTVENYRFAPNSTVNLLIDGNQESLQAGIYDLTIKATTKKPEGTWTMKKEFTISNAVAQEMDDANQDSHHHDALRYTLIGCLILLIGTGIVVSISYRQQHLQKTKRKKRKKKNQSIKK